MYDHEFVKYSIKETSGRFVKCVIKVLWILNHLISESLKHDFCKNRPFECTLFCDGKNFFSKMGYPIVFDYAESENHKILMDFMIRFFCAAIRYIAHVLIKIMKFKCVYLGIYKC